MSSIPARSTIIHWFLCRFICISLCQSIKTKPTNIYIYNCWNYGIIHMLNPQNTPHTKRVNYGVSFVNIFLENWPCYNDHALCSTGENPATYSAWMTKYVLVCQTFSEVNLQWPWHDIKNNAWVTMNNDFLVTSGVICQWFSQVKKSRVKIIGKSPHEWQKSRYSR